MGWDPERYREKREKVLGVKRRGIPFSLLAAGIVFVIIGGAAFMALPGAISYMKTRHLDDAIFKLADNGVWSSQVATAFGNLDGVRQVSLDTHNTRLVITFDRRVVRPQDFSALFSEYGVTPSLLNRISHRQRMTTLAMEKEEQGEAS